MKHQKRSCINRSESNRPSIHLCVRHSEPRSLVRQRDDLSLQWTYQNKETGNDQSYATTGYDEGEERALVWRVLLLMIAIKVAQCTALEKETRYI